MKYFSINELNDKEYKPVEIEVVGGSRPRLVLKKGKNNLKHFLKSYRHNTREIMAEFLASKLGSLAGFKIQKTWIKVLPVDLIRLFEKKYQKYLPPKWKPIGALVKNIFPRGYNVRYGFDILKGAPSDKFKLSKIKEAIVSINVKLQSSSHIFEMWL